MHPSIISLVAVAWFLLSLLMGSINDTLMQAMGYGCSAFQITFLRFFWALLTLMPLMAIKGPKAFKTKRMRLHWARGGLLFLGMALWAFSLKWVSVPTATVITFTIPLFTLLLAIVILKERVSWPRWAATFVGLIGTAVVLKPSATVPIQAVGILLSVIAFSLLDVINKKYVAREPMLPMLFYSNIATLVFSAGPALFSWTPIGLGAHGLFLLLGLSSNLLLYALLRAFKQADISLLAPFRYCELLFSTGITFILYNTLPPLTTWIGAAIIVPSSLFIVYEAEKLRRRYE